MLILRLEVVALELSCCSIDFYRPIGLLELVFIRNGVDYTLSSLRFISDVCFYFCSSAEYETVKELLKPVHICKSYCKKIKCPPFLLSTVYIPDFPPAIILAWRPACGDLNCIIVSDLARGWWCEATTNDWTLTTVTIDQWPCSGSYSAYFAWRSASTASIESINKRRTVPPRALPYSHRSHCWVDIVSCRNNGPSLM